MNTLAYYAVVVPSLLFAITGHEFAHAWVAFRNGDPTAAQRGRLTLNPFAHLDPLGTLAIVLIGFGWGKPVPVNRALLRSPRADLWVSAAGPCSNLLMAATVGMLIRLPVIWTGIELAGLAPAAGLFVPVFVQMNIMLAVFNFLPLGPLDGSHMMENLLPIRASLPFQRFNAAYGNFMLLGLILLGRVLPVSPLSVLLDPPITFFRQLFLGA